MPTYGYECTRCKEKFETFQKITDDPLTIHEECGGELRRLLYPVGIVFKGPGFHVNDYGKSGKNGAKEKPAETKPEPKPESKPETKTESTASTSND